MRFRILSLILSAGLLGAATAPAQELPATDLAPVPGQSRPQFVPNSFLVMFEKRGFDLSALRAAIYARRSAAEVERIVQDLEDAVQRHQADFVRRVEARGGEVVDQWWIINGACVEIDAEQRPWLEQLPNVASVHRNPIYHPVNKDARNGQHHNAVGANNRRTKAGVPVDGKGVGVAVLDTGVDGNMGGSGRPHRGYFVNGDPNNKTGGGIGGSRLKAVFGTSGFGTEDAHGHGTHVSGSVGNAWSQHQGMAPGSWIIGVKISSNSGGATGNWLIAGWQLVAAQRQSHTIAVANNSFSGSPNLSDPIQVALDSTAFNADVLICCSAGNRGNNTRRSQNVWNGLAVGSINKFSLSVSSFSARGPLFGHGRNYPDVMGVGAGVVSLRRDSESVVARASGTSMSSPMVAGGAALVRQVDARMTAREAKALLLNNTKGNASRNTTGEGILECDLAVQAALKGDYRSVKMTAPTKVWNASFTPQLARSTSITVTWMRNGNQTPDNLDIKVFDPNGRLVIQDGNPKNSYERVTFTPSVGGAHRLEVTWANQVFGNRTIEFAVAGIGSPVIKPPTLTKIAPAKVTSFQPAEVTLTGTNLDTIDTVTLGTTRVSGFKAVNATTLKFTPPSPFDIATHKVTVANRAGKSQPLNLTVTGNHPGVLRAPSIAVRGFKGAPFEVNTDKNWQALILVSTSNQPSAVPGVVSLGIGNAFTELWEFWTVTAGSDGYGKFDFTWPKNMLNPPLWFQAVPYDPTNLTVPFEVTNIRQTTIF